MKKLLFTLLILSSIPLISLGATFGYTTAGSSFSFVIGANAGLVAYYQFYQGLDAMDNTGITSLTDSSVTANNGTLFIIII